MKTKREAPDRRSVDRRRSDAARNAVRRQPETPSGVRPRRRGAPSAPAREARTGPQTSVKTQPTAAKNVSQAKARAKARKAKAPKVVRQPLRERLLLRLSSIDLRPRTLAAKVPFVVLVIGSLGVGLGITLWLSTDAAERSYQLGHAREVNRALLQQKEALERDVLESQAAPALADAAQQLGMIPSRDTAHLVQDAAGNWVVVGSPQPAEGVAPPPLNAKLPDPQPDGPPTPAVDPVEVPVRVSPESDATTPAGTPEILLRAPDGATTLGTEHLPAEPAAEAPQPAAPGPVAVPPTAGVAPTDAAAPTPVAEPAPGGQQ